MRIRIVYEGSIEEWPGPFFLDQTEGEVASQSGGYTRRSMLGLSGGLLAASLSIPLWLPQRAFAQKTGLIDASLASFTVARQSVAPSGQQTSYGNVGNRSNQIREGLYVGEFVHDSSGIVTDQGSKVLLVNPGRFITAEIQGSVGTRTGRGKAVGYTQIETKSQGYNIG